MAIAWLGWVVQWTRGYLVFGILCFVFDMVISTTADRTVL